MDNQTPRARILLVDNDPRLVADMGIILGEEFELIPVSATGPGIIEAARRLAWQHWPQAAMIDMRLLEDDNAQDFSGVDLALELCPHCPCILYSAHLTSTVTRRISSAGSISWVQKDEHADVLKDEIRRALKHTRPDAQALRLPEGWSEQQILALVWGEQAAGFPPGALHSVLSKCLRPAAGVKLAWLQAPPEPGAPVDSLTFIIESQDPRLALAAVKLGQPDDLEKELSAYQTAQQEGLSSFTQVRLDDRPAHFWGLAALLYQLPGRPVNTWADIYHSRSRPLEALAPLAIYFRKNWRPAAEQRRPASRPALQAYRELFQLSEADFSLLPPVDHLPAGWWLNPAEWLERQAQQKPLTRSHSECWIMGRLWGEQVLLDEQDRVWTANYQGSGIGPTPADFATLEVDIAAHLAELPLEPAGLFIDFAALLMGQQRPDCFLPGPSNFPSLVAKSAAAMKALAVIAGVRALAFQVAGYRTMNEYYTGLLCSALHLYWRASGAMRKKAGILAGFAAARLDEPAAAWAARLPMTLLDAFEYRMLAERIRDDMRAGRGSNDELAARLSEAELAESFWLAQTPGVDTPSFSSNC